MASNLVSVIIMAKDPADLFTMRKKVEEVGVVQDDLPLIDGLVAQVPSDLKDDFWKSSSRSGVTMVANEMVWIPTPMEALDPTGPGGGLGSQGLSGSSQSCQLPSYFPRMDVTRDLLGMERVWKAGYTGKGIGIAIIDTGIFPHPDVARRLVAFKDLVGGQDGMPYDDNGHGTHVAGDAAGDGTVSSGAFMGTAPGAHLVAIKAMNTVGGGSMADIIKGIQWAIEHKDELKVRVLSLSLGGRAFQKAKNDPISLAIEKAARAGIIPVVASGNDGPEASTVSTPGISTSAITVGAWDDRNTVQKDDDVVAPFSSRGPALRDGWRKPDLLAPGVRIVGPVATGSFLDVHPAVPHVGRAYIAVSGTSMATPLVAGIVATMLEADPSLTLQRVKEILAKTAQPLKGVNPDDQGAGRIDPPSAVAEVLKMKSLPQKAAA